MVAALKGQGITAQRQGDTAQSLAKITIHAVSGQEEHHRKTTFQDELILLLKKHKIEFDERYLWA